MSRCDDDCFGEATYRAWRAGINPDRVSRDRVSSLCDSGLDCDQIAGREVRRLRDQDQREREILDEDQNH